MKMISLAAVAAALIAVPGLALAQDSNAAAAAPPAAEAPAGLQLAANTPITLSMNNELTSKHAREGDTFPLTVVQDVAVDGHVVIPRGTRAVGEVIWRTGRGAFGKSGKMEVAFRYLDLGGRRIPLEGVYRQEGEGNTAATVGAVLGAGIVGGLVVTGHSAVIPQGRELQARTIDAIPIVIGAAPADGAPAPAMIADSYAPSPLQTGRPRPTGSGHQRH
jgi:hypothetical protein